jgi:hypothetical protein
MKPFGAGRTGVIYTQVGQVNAATSEAGAAFGAPVAVATPAAMPSPAAVALAGAGEGSAVGFWADGTNSSDSALYATPFDATPPEVLNIQAPATLVAGVAGTFSATERDDWSTPLMSWLFGDGATLPGEIVQHAFATDGVFGATATATDQVGNTASDTRSVTVTPAPLPPVPPGDTTPAVDETPPPPPPSPPAAPLPDTRAPVLSGVRLVPAILRRGRKKTTLKFRVDEAATVVAQLERARPGFRSGKRCVARRPSTGTAKRCTRFVRSGAALKRVLTAPGSGKLTIKRPRALGRYRVRVYAADVALNRSAEKRPALTVL